MKDDLISRAEAVNMLKTYDPSMVWDTADVEAWVNALPWIDRGVIRCRQCLFWDRETLEHKDFKFYESDIAECILLGVRDPEKRANHYVEEDDFCSCAERRTDE